MLTRSPCESYVKFLVVHPDRYTNAEIRRILDLARLDYIGDSYFNRLRERFTPPEVFRPLDLKHEASQKFLVDLDIWELFHPDVNMNVAFDLLEAPSAKEAVEALLMLNADKAGIAILLRVEYGVEGATEEAVQKYQKHFWNTRIIDHTDLRVLLDLRARVGSRSSDSFIKDAVALYKRHMKNDVRYMMAHLPEAPSSTILARVRMGVSPAGADVGDTLERCLSILALRLNEAVYLGDKGYDIRMRNLAMCAKLIQEIKDNRARPVDELRKEIAAMQIKTNKESAPLLQTLSNGNHTADLLGLPLHEEEDDGEPDKR